MRRREQLTETLNAAITEALANTHTATVARVTGVDATTINVRPVINRVVNGESVELPEFIEVPPVFLQGGGSYTAHPIAVGDYCLLIFAERAFDQWYEGQDFRDPVEPRLHDYSDAFAIVGVNTRAGAFTIPDVITRIGDSYHDGNHEQDGNLTRTGTSDQTGDETVTGNSTVDGNETVTGNQEAATYSVGGTFGASGTFTTADSKTVTVVNGLITSIV